MSRFAPFSHAAILGVAVLMTACANGAKSEAAADQTTASAALNNDDYYEVYHDQRLYVFDDADTYKSFLAHGETPYIKVRIGDGPDGRTLVFGLTGEDKKKQKGIASIDMYDGRMEGADDFYGEIKHEDGRLYVFSEWEDMQSFREVGEAPFRYTMIGAGPNGETVVLVLNSANKKKRPEALLNRFKKMHGSH